MVIGSAILPETMALLRATLDASPDMIQVFRALRDAEGRIVDFTWLLNNSVSEKIYGDVIGQRLLEHNPGVVTEGIFAVFCRVTDTGLSDEREYHYEHEEFNGWFRQSVVKLGDGVATTTTEITARKQAEAEQLRRQQVEEEALRQRERRQAFLLELNDALALLVQPEDIQYQAACVLGSFLGAARVGYANDGGDDSRVHVTRNYTDGVRGIEGTYRYQDYGATLMQELKAGRTVLHADIAATDDLSAREKAAHAGLQIGASVNMPLVKGGVFTAVLFVHYAGPHQWTDEELLLIEEVLQRTWASVEQARAEAALRASEEQFRHFVSASSDTLYRMSADWRQMYFLSGGRFLPDSVEVEESWVEKYIPEPDRQLVWEAIRKAIAGGGLFELEHRVIRADGSIGWTFSRAVPVCDAEGRVTAWFGAASDITARKEAERHLKEFNSILEEQVVLRTRELKQSRERFEAAIHVSPQVLSILRCVRGKDGRIADFHFEWVSRSGERLVGRDVTGERLLSAFPNIVRIGLMERFVQTANTGTATDFEYRYDAEGLDLWLNWKAVRFDDGLFVSVEDITPRKEVEEKVQTQANFINRVSSIVPDLVTVTELPSKRLLYSNRDPLAAAGRRLDDLVTLPPAERDRLFQVHPEDASRLRHHYEKVSKLADGAVATLEYRARYDLAGWRWYTARGSVFARGADGRVTAVLNVVQDITAQRAAEDELKEEHYFLEQVTDNTPHLIYVFDLAEQRFIYINRRIGELTGYPPDYVYGMGPHLFRMVAHPDDLGRRTAYMEQLAALRPGEIRESEFRLRVGAGWRWFRSKDRIFKTKEGAVAQVIGLAEDVTYEKLLEEKLRGGGQGLN